MFKFMYSHHISLLAAVSYGEHTVQASPLGGADRQPQYSSNYTLLVALQFVSYARLFAYLK